MRYEDILAVRWSELKSMRHSPLQYRHDLRQPHTDSTAMKVGRLIHTLVLEPLTSGCNRKEQGAPYSPCLEANPSSFVAFRLNEMVSAYR